MHARTAGEGRIRVTLSCCPHQAKAADLGSETHGIRRACRRCCATPVARSLESGVEVAWIGDEWLFLCLQKCHEPVPGDPEEWAQHAAVAEFTDRGYSGKPVNGAPSSAANQMRLDLIVSMMAGQQMKAASLATPASEQLVPRDAGSFLDSARRFFTGPDEHFVTDPSRRQPRPELVDFGSALGSKAMIDGQRADLPALVARPSIGENGEGQAVGTTGNGDSEKRSRFETHQGGEGSPELAEAQRFCR